MKSLAVAVLAALCFGGLLAACSGGASDDGLGGGGSVPADGGAGAEGGGDGDGDGGPVTIDAKEFAGTCATADDCVAVYSGDVCALCLCDNDAIAKSDLESWNARREQLGALCPPREDIACASGCADVTMACSSEGRCVVTAPDVTADGG